MAKKRSVPRPKQAQTKQMTYTTLRGQDVVTRSVKAQHKVWGK
jgi:hypothetical protein